MHDQVSKKWFIHKNGQQFGPFSDDELHGMVSNNQLHQNDHVWKEGMEAWQLASSVSNLFKVTPPPPPPTPQGIASYQETGASTAANSTSKEIKQFIDTPIEKYSSKNEQEGSFKFSTVIFLILGLLLPLWPITLPLFWYLAYKSYKN